MSGKVTIYCVQPYWWDGRKLAHGSPEQYRTREEAKRVAKKLYAWHAGVAVYAVCGWPEYEAWDEPTLVDSVGSVLTL